MSKGNIQQVVHMLCSAFKQLHVEIPAREVERLVVLIHRAMTDQARNYHNLEHVLSLSNDADAVQTLAALFHDIIYYQVDSGFAPDIYRVIAPYIEEKADQIFIQEKIDPADQIAHMTLAIYDYQEGQKLSPFEGLNEFLSALLMNKLLENSMKAKDLMRITVCIEATIPFRKPDEQGRSQPEILFTRLETVNRLFNCEMSTEEMHAAIEKSVLFANLDVGNFADADVRVFLDSTWKLLPETNYSLRTKKIYSIQEYRIAIQKTEGFMRTVNPETVFRIYRDEPSIAAYQQMQARAEKNILIGREYLGIKLLTVAVLEALAELTGGDAPIALFMGEIQESDEPGSGGRLEDYLPDVEPPEDGRDPAIYELLHSGRAGQPNFDLKNAPLALFIYLSLGSHKVHAFLEDARQMFKGSLSSHAFLDKLPAEMIATITRACAEMAATRSEALRALAKT